MKTRAILVGSYNDRKLFYLLTPYGEQKLDGALVSRSDAIEYLPFMQFITTTADIKEFKFSKFHRFLWSPPPRNEDRNRWSRMFLSKTQPIDDELLVGAKVVTELVPGKKSKKSAEERAYAFRRKMINPSSPHLDGTQLRRSFIEPLRSATGAKALGPSLSVNRSVDGDGDGFVNDGLPTMRPFVPGFDFVLDESGKPQSMRSIRTARADTVKERSISGKTMLERVQDIKDHVAVRHNGGKSLKTKADAQRVLTKIIPGFGRTDRGRSYIDFLDEMRPDDELHPWQEAYISQFVFMLEDEPLRNTVRWKISRLDSSAADSGVNGQTSAPQRTAKWEPVDESLLLRGSGPRMRPRKMYEQPGIEIEYSHDDNFANRVGWGWILRQDKKNFNVLSAAISKQMQVDTVKLVNLRDVAEIAPLALGMRRETLDAISQLVASFSFFQDELVSVAVNANPQLLKVIERNLPFILETVDSINRVDANLLGISLEDVQQEMLGGTLNDMRYFLDNLSMATTMLTTQGRYKQTIDAVNGVVEKWSPINQTFTGIHEMTHALHFLRMQDKLRQRAAQLRSDYLSNLSKQFAQEGKTLPDKETLEKQLPVESFYLDVYKESLQSFAQNDPDGFRRRLLYWASSQNDVLHRTEYEPDGVTPRPGIDALLPFYLGQFAQTSNLISNYDSVGGAQLGRLLGLPFPISRQEASELDKDISRILNKAIYFGNQPVRMNASIARVLNEISQTTGNARLGVANKTGDVLTPYHLFSMLSPDLLQWEASSHRNDFRGVMLGTGSNFPSAFVLDTLGYPDIKISGSGEIAGLTAEEARPIADALLGVGPMMDRIHTSISSLAGGSVSNFDRIRAATENNNLIKPNEVLLPRAFRRFGINTFEDFESADMDTLIAATNAAIDEVGNNQIQRAKIPNAFGKLTDTTGLIFEMLPTSILELAPFSDAEKEQLREISGRVGLPAAPGAILRNDSPGYSSYQATLVSQQTLLSSDGFSLAEFAAETGLSEMLGIPLAQVAKGGGFTRPLTNEEMQLVYRYMLWIFGGSFPGDKLARFDEVPL